MGTRWADSLILQLIAESGEVAASLGPFPYVELQQNARYPAPPWLSPRGAFAGGEDRFYAGFGNRFEIRTYTGAGALHSIIRRSWSPVPVTAEDWEQWVVEWSKLWIKKTGAASDSAVAVVRGSSYAEPAFSAFLVDRTGRLWVRGAHWQDAISAGSLTDMPLVPSQWSVFDRSGRWLGDVEMPRHFAPKEIGSDYVAGESWSGGMTQVVIYELQRAAKEGHEAARLPAKLPNSP